MDAHELIKKNSGSGTQKGALHDSNFDIQSNLNWRRKDKKGTPHREKGPHEKKR